VNVHPISPIRFEEGAGVRAIEDFHVPGNTIWRQSSMLKTQPILRINFESRMQTSRIIPVSGTTVL
jgi:hypothetical protein